MAKKIGIGSRMYYRIDTGKSGTTLKRLDKIASVLEVDIIYLITGKNLQPPVPKRSPDDKIVKAHLFLSAYLREKQFLERINRT